MELGWSVIWRLLVALCQPAHWSQWTGWLGCIDLLLLLLSQWLERSLGFTSTSGASNGITPTCLAPGDWQLSTAFETAYWILLYIIHIATSSISLIFVKIHIVKPHLCFFVNTSVHMVQGKIEPKAYKDSLVRPRRIKVYTMNKCHWVVCEWDFDRKQWIKIWVK